LGFIIFIIEGSFDGLARVKFITDAAFEIEFYQVIQEIYLVYEDGVKTDMKD
jgi:hypothetical protein